MRTVLGTLVLVALGMAGWGDLQTAPVVAPLASGVGSGIVGAATAAGVFQALQRGEDADMARAFLDQVTGQNPVTCGMTLRGVRGGWGWGSSMVTLVGVSHLEGPDAQLLAWATGSRYDDDVIRPLVQALSHGDACRREVAGALLGRADRDRAWVAVAPLAREGGAVARSAAILALGYVEAPESRGLLEGALGDGDVTVRRASAWALGQLEAPSSVAALAGALATDADEGVRGNAAWALGQVERSDGVEPLARALERDAAPTVRINAAWALGQIEDAEAIPALTRALGADSDPLVRKAAAWALGQVAES